MKHASTLRRFGAESDAVAAVEFAFVMPILVILMLASTQIVLYINATRKVQLVASSISEMLSQQTPPNSSTTIATVSPLDLHFAWDSALVLFPYVMFDAQRANTQWWSDISVNFASIQFKANQGVTCPAAGDQSPCYTAWVAWTQNLVSNSSTRKCANSGQASTQSPTNDTAAPTSTTLPRSIYGSGSIIAVDIGFNFVPTFGSRYLPTILIKRSVFVQPRYASSITLASPFNDQIATPCPGF